MIQEKIPQELAITKGILYRAIVPAGVGTRQVVITDCYYNHLKWFNIPYSDGKIKIDYKEFKKYSNIKGEKNEY
ncbi:MAG: hypothetical protein WCG95_00240 [bacterium]